MTRNDFKAFLNARGGCTVVSLLTRTEPKMLKTGNPFKSVIRVTRRNGFIGGEYESCVNNKQEREGGERDFVSQSLPWGQHEGRFFVTHNGGTYLAFLPKYTGCDGQDTWLADGQEVDVTAVQAWLPKSSPSKSGVEWRTIKLESIVAITIDGQTITLTDAEAAPVQAPTVSA